MSEHPIRYACLGYAALQVTDLAASTRFYSELMGLSVAQQDEKSAWLRCSDKPYDLILEAGEKPGLSRIGFELESRTELAMAFEHIESTGLSPIWATGTSFRFRNPDTGLALDYYADQPFAATPYEPSVTQIIRLGHVVLNVASYADAHRFWVEQLGFEISDHVPGKIAFLRCFPNPLHHSLALLTGESDGLNHFNFMVTDIDDIGRAMNRMKQADVPIVFGPGRHLPSGSIFLYVLDPDGMTTEFSFGMEEFPETGARAPRELEPKPEVLDTWGSIADPRFGCNCRPAGTRRRDACPGRLGGRRFCRRSCE
jgi:2,3-dihydroxy-p-cumate/2,3-dihydroxybenzoate 3,4-dioxygenase